MGAYDDRRQGRNIVRENEAPVIGHRLHISHCVYTIQPVVQPVG